MHIILLSGGSGTRLWPLSNHARSKQFLRVLDTVTGTDSESMIQRVYRQIRESGIQADITVATSVAQVDSVMSQLGEAVEVVAEPSRRDTFPAIALACEYLAKERHCNEEEIVVVMPCDPYTESGYFSAISEMVAGVIDNKAEMMVMGIRPTYPSAKYGYVLPDHSDQTETFAKVERFIEKPSAEIAESLIEQGAFWNGGVFAFKLGYLLKIAERYNDKSSFEEIKNSYDSYPKISFDYEVAEKASDIGMVKFTGYWKDLGTWNTLTDELNRKYSGNILTDGTDVNTHIFNELDIPILCVGTKDLVIAAAHDGILVTEKSKSESIKEFASQLKHRPMYEERRWGTYRVIGYSEFPDGHCALTKQLTLNPGGSISYQRHNCRDEIWTFIDGEGRIVLDGEEKSVMRGDVINISKGQRHALKAITPLTFIEVQSGTNLIEEDIERFPYDWKE